MDKTVLLSAPLHNRAWILPHYFDKVYKLDYPKKLMSIYFIVNNCTDNTLELAKEFKSKYESEYNSIKIEVYNSAEKFQDDRFVHIREKYTYSWLSELRNKMMKECYNKGYDYIFSCDSDILIAPDTLKRLLSHNKPYIAGLIYNGYLFKPSSSDKNYDTIVNAYKFPNILKGNLRDGFSHIVNYKVKNPNLNPIGTLQETNFTGAIFVAHRDVCRVMKYEPHAQGEDCLASISAQNAGYQLFCDVSIYSQHIMNQDLLQKYLNGELKFSNEEAVKL